MPVVPTYPSRLGDINLAAGTQTAEENFALFLKKFSGEVMSTFHTASVFKNLQRTRTLTNGKSAQFPVIGTANSSFHVPGESILQSTDGGGDPKYLSQIANGERLISVDHARQSSVFVSSLDELLNHYETRSTYAMELGLALAERADSDWARMFVLAARDTATITGQDRGGAVITKGFDLAATGADRAELTYQAAYEAAEIFDTKGVPKMDRYFVVDPATYYQLVQYKADMLVDADLSPGNGNVAKAQLKMIADMPIMVSTRIPSTVVANETGARNDYSGTFTNTRMLAVQKQAIGTVMVRDISIQTADLVEYQGSLIVAKHVWGSNILRPECAIEIENG